MGAISFEAKADLTFGPHPIDQRPVPILLFTSESIEFAVKFILGLAVRGEIVRDSSPDALAQVSVSRPDLLLEGYFDGQEEVKVNLMLEGDGPLAEQFLVKNSAWFAAQIAVEEVGYFVVGTPDVQDPLSLHRLTPVVSSNNLRMVSSVAPSRLVYERWAGRQYLRAGGFNLKSVHDWADPKGTIKRLVGPWCESDRPYMAPLPLDLARWHCYVTGLGHCVLAVPKNGQMDSRLEPLLVPLPLKTIRREGYIVIDGVILASETLYDHKMHETLVNDVEL